MSSPISRKRSNFAGRMVAILALGAFAGSGNGARLIGGLGERKSRREPFIGGDIGLEPWEIGQEEWRRELDQASGAVPRGDANIAAAAKALIGRHDLKGFAAPQEVFTLAGEEAAIAD